VLVAAVVLGGIALFGPGEDRVPAASPTFTTEPPPTDTPGLDATPTTQPPRTETTVTQPPLGNDVVTVAAQASGHPAAPVAVHVLTAYFQSINSRDFVTYRSPFTSAIQGQMSLEQLAAGYRSTYDSQVQLSQIDDLADGRVAAWVDFMSTQDAVDGPDGQTCTLWSIGLFLQAEGGRVVIGRPPAGYQASYRAC